jgi:hypothetical protein
MATQKEVKSYIEKNLNADALEDDIFKIVYDLGNERSQVVFVQVASESLNIASPFAKSEDVTPKQAFKAIENYAFGIGTLGDWYVVRHVVPLADLDESEIIHGFEIVAMIADELEDSLVGGDAL